ncbi:MAG: 23S rRNA (adenine(2503)-C(2))-methyltransferase RlmN [Myxococcales bacterium]|jgi:23S rRNA (adenine2503-C2)-methyltransferase|nr:MAG: 23S rRNA (adenine(2503)-C(2))-methyltransferase RlmN [Myxococcales bacterium]
MSVAGRKRPDLRSQRLADLAEWVERRGFEPYRASQIAGWAYNRSPAELGDMSNLPAEVRAALEEDFDCSLPRVAHQSESVDGTIKLLVELGDTEVIESVIIPREERLTLCISSQVGCAIDCAFCATARLGLRRNLEPAEIVVQVLHARAKAAPHPLTNYVFMGMGEPLANYDRLLRAIEIMTARWGLAISPRRITVSTAGLVPQLERLARDTSVHVAVSLTAARDELRDRLMPINKRYPLAELMAACKRLELPRRKRVTLEYVLLGGVNDTARDARELIALVHDIPVKLNLIPFNPFPGSGFERPDDATVERFQEQMLAAGIHATVRKSRGRDIEAACGQLATAAGAGSTYAEPA